MIINILDGDNLNIPSDLNTVSFDLSYPMFNYPTSRVRCRLHGYEKVWSEEGQSLQKRYIGLSAGSYVFEAEVYNEQGVLASLRQPFVVMRPWYLTPWAILLYVLGAISLIALVQYRLYVRMRRKRTHIIEQQEKKIIALENEHLEADLRSKSKELSAVLMTNIAHQEVLNGLKAEIQQQKLSGQYSRKQLDKLLAMVNNNLVTDEETWSVFQTNFDHIHDKFFRNLKQRYPDLTSGDLRFCALIRLNLPTKEIAKLQNISVRGVEAARYRLRRKFSLAQEDSLTDFLINFK